MKYIILIITLFASWPCLYGQTDSVQFQSNLNAVEVFSDSYTFMSTYDSLLRERNVSSNLGQVLQQTGSAQVLNYGAQGALITARVNGTASDHTTVSWNGLNINSPSLGLADLSLLPAFFFDDPQLRLYSTKRVGQGGIAANLGLSAPDHSPSEIRWSTGLNSLLNGFIAMRIGMEGSQIYLDARILKESNRNEFYYRDRFKRGSPLTQQENNNSIQDAANLTVGWHSRKRPLKIKAYSWWQDRSMNVPSPMGVSNNQKASQKDSLWRFGAELEWNNGQWIASFVRSNEFQNYVVLVPFLEVPTIDSEYAVANSLATLSNKSSWRKWSSFLEARYNVVRVENSNYSMGVANEHVGAANASFRNDFSENGSLEIFIYHELRSNFKTEPSFGFIFKSKDKRPRNVLPGVIVSISRKFRVPDFNERFWVPGGNEGLQSETGFQGQCTFQWDLMNSDKWFCNVAWENIAQQIENWIQWVPEGIWIPKNYRLVRSFSSNLQLDLGYKWKSSKLLFTGRWRWNKTQAVNSAIWNSEETFKMAYNPMNTGAIGVDFVGKFWDTGIHYRFTDIRFSRDAVSQMANPPLPSQSIYDAFLGCRWGHSSFRLRCDNLFDLNFENIWGYPMPGRVWQVQWSQNFSFNNK